MRFPRPSSVPAGLGGPLRKTNDPTQSMANNTWRIGSEPSGKDRNCCAGFSSLPAGFTRRNQIQSCSQTSEMAPSAPGQIHGRTKSVALHSSMLVPMPAALTGQTKTTKQSKCQGDWRKTSALSGYRQLQFEVGSAFAIYLDAQAKRVKARC